ncbi:MAG TPA: enolase C-terminal domain-like protein [Candidatus Binatia bacterium]|nr:enolase C-terminal domain-like protein [Candidatus Binatia bacterium]
MSCISKFEIFAVDLPFRRVFKHAAAERNSSSSLFVKCATDDGHVGYGECLPREYVTGESRNEAFKLLRDKLLSRMLGMKFNSLDQVKAFLIECDGKAPEKWGSATGPQTAAWCAVDLALLDCFGHALQEPVRLGDGDRFPDNVKYSPVLSAESGFEFLKTLIKIRLYGFRQVKLKLGGGADTHLGYLARRVLGKNVDIRTDANMAWSVDEALSAMRDLARYGVSSFEQPIAAGDISGLARVVKESGLGVMVDEGLSDRASLRRLINEHACTAVNVRISKCGGLMASLARCREALDAGLTLQIGCQVGESSLLSAAHLILVAAVQKVRYAEGCFGYHLLREDPAEPVLQFGYGGRPPARPKGAGLGVAMNEAVLKRWTVQQAIVEKA